MISKCLHQRAYFTTREQHTLGKLKQTKMQWSKESKIRKALNWVSFMDTNTEVPENRR